MRTSCAVAFVTLCLSGCGGGGGGGGGAGASYPLYPASTADSLLLPIVTAAGELKLFDPLMPDADPATVDTGLSAPVHSGPVDDVFLNAGLYSVLTGSYAAASHRIADGHSRYVWYFKDGTPYRVDLLRTSVHTPVQFSSITDACGWNSIVGDLQDPLKTRVLVETAGADMDCGGGDNEARLVTLDTAADDAGIAAPVSLLLFESVQSVEGAVEKLLTLDFATGVFSVHAPDLSSSETLLTVDVEQPLGGGPDPSRTRQYFRFVTAGENVLRLYRYDATEDSLTPLHTYADKFDTFVLADATDLYFNDGLDIYRLAHSSSTPELLHTLDVSVEAAHLTTSRLVLQLDQGDGTRTIESLPKTGATTRTVLEAATDEPLTIVATAGERVYFNQGSPITTVSAHRVRGDGAGAADYPNARWGGEVNDPDLNIGATDLPGLVRTLLLGRGDPFGVVTVSPVDARTGIEGPALGTIDGAVFGQARGTGRYVLLNAFINRDPELGGGGDDFDVYFLDVQGEASLRPAATTPFQDDAGAGL